MTAGRRGFLGALAAFVAAPFAPKIPLSLPLPEALTVSPIIKANVLGGGTLRHLTEELMLEAFAAMDKPCRCQFCVTPGEGINVLAILGGTSRVTYPVIPRNR